MHTKLNCKADTNKRQERNWGRHYPIKNRKRIIKVRKILHLQIQTYLVMVYHFSLMNVQYKFNLSPRFKQNFPFPYFSNHLSPYHVPNPSMVSTFKGLQISRCHGCSGLTNQNKLTLLHDPVFWLKAGCIFKNPSRRELMQIYGNI